MINTNLINKSDMKKAWAIAKINFKNIKLVYFLTIGLFLVVALQAIIVTGIIGVEDNGNVMSNMLLLGIILAPILIPARNFRKVMSLNGKKKNFFLGSLINYLIIAFVITLLIIILHYTIENPVNNRISGEFPTFLTIYDALGWSSNGPIVGFLQLFGFTFFMSVFIHLLTSLQDNWVGWLFDVLIIVLLAVFIPIEILRIHFWGNLLDLIVLGHPAIQITFTIFGGVLLYSTYLLILKSKKI